MKGSGLLLALLAVLSSACNSIDHLAIDRSAGNGRDTVKLKLDYSCAESQTKTISISDNLVNDISMFIYNSSGNLVQSQYSQGNPRTMNVLTTNGESYRFVCAANCGNLTLDNSVRTLSGILSYRYSVSNYSGTASSSGAVPMTYDSGNITLHDGMTINIVLTRCVAQCMVAIDKSALNTSSKFNVTSMRLCNMPSSVLLFGSSRIERAQERFSSGDYADAVQLTKLNSGDTVAFTMFENRQGRLLPSNSLQSGKVFPQNSQYRNICSYIEFDVELNTSRVYGSATYRFYLGEDATSDFSITRNCRYSVTIVPTEDGIDENSWRIDKSDINPYASSINITAPTTRLYTKGAPSGTTFTATLSPASAQQTVNWSSSNPSIASVSNGTVTARSEGQAWIYATATDGSRAKDSVLISVVRPRTTSISLNISGLHLDLPVEKKLLATYENGFTEYVTDYITWNFDSNIISESADSFTPIDTGSTTINAVYNDGYDRVTMSENYTIYGVREVTPSGSRTYLTYNYAPYRTLELMPEIKYLDGYTAELDVSDAVFSIDPQFSQYLSIDGNVVTALDVYPYREDIPVRVTSSNFTGTINLTVDEAFINSTIKSQYTRGDTDHVQVWIEATYYGFWLDYITNDVEWVITPRLYINIMSGNLYANFVGDVTVTANYGGLSRTWEIPVIPDY